jgi:hypothetical protein
MNGDMQQGRDSASRTAAFTVRVAGMVTAGVVVALAVAPEALARLTANHNETVLTLD